MRISEVACLTCSIAFALPIVAVEAQALGIVRPISVLAHKDCFRFEVSVVAGATHAPRIMSAHLVWVTGIPLFILSQSFIF